MKLQPKQAAALLTNHNQYLLHACIKGVKGKYDQILLWYQSLYQTSKHFTGMINDHFANNTAQGLNSAYMLLNTIKSGFYSHHIQVVEWTYKLFVKIAQDFDEGECLDQHQKWCFLMPSSNSQSLGGGLEASLYALQRNSTLVEQMALFLNVTFRDQFPKLVQELRNNHAKNFSHFVAMINEVLPNLHKQNKEEVERDIILESGILEECI